MLNNEMRLRDGVAGATINPFVSCPKPSTNCTWPEISTLAICSDFKDVTASISSNCTVQSINVLKNSNASIVCNYTSPDINFQNRNLMIDFGRMGLPLANLSQFLSFQSVLDAGNKDNVTEIGQLIVARVVGDLANASINLNNTSTLPALQVTRSKWYWCKNTYHNVTLLNGEFINLQPVKSEALIHDRYVPAGPVGFFDYFNSSASDQHVTNFRGDHFRDRFRTIDTRIAFIPSQSPGHTAANRTVATGEQFPIGKKLPETEYSQDPLHFADFMATANIQKATSNIATALTNEFLRAPDNGGDNMNMTTTRGKAYAYDTYIKVRWAWLSLPLLMIVCTCILLIITIVVNEQPLLKHSSVALLAHRLDGWEEDEIRVSGKETIDKWDGWAENHKASLQQDASGKAMFVRWQDSRV
jgi:hypothetical protein